MRCHAWAALIITLLTVPLHTQTKKEEILEFRVQVLVVSRIIHVLIIGGWELSDTGNARPNVHREIPENLIYKYLAF